MSAEPFGDCQFCGEPITSHMSAGRFRDGWVHGICAYAVWLFGRNPFEHRPRPSPIASVNSGGRRP